jgi:2-iminobutanoate/2-iminopropanoate deaminase
MEPVRTDLAPRPAGHYEQAWVHEGLVYVSGQLPIDPEVGPPSAESGARIGPVEEQTERALRNVEAILSACGTRLDRVIKTTVYVSDISLWPQVNAAYGRVFGDHRPARSIVPSRELHFGYQVEIEAIAAVQPS